MNNREFEQLLNSVRDDTPDDQTIRNAAARVHARLVDEMGESATVDHLASCADFRALLPDYRANRLSEARRMLVEDHLHTCVACRRAFQGARLSLVPMQPKPAAWQKAVPYGIAAAILAAMAYTLPPVFDRMFAPSGPRATIASVDGGLYRVSDQGLMALATGAPLNEHDEIRTAKASRAVVRLNDGSMIEMAERSALTVSERWSGKTIYLDRGSVMIEAAKQRRGRLEVITPDCAVSVKGTIFEVSRGTKGSRVSVVEGEVKVDREGDTQLLHRGDQTATSISMSNTTVAQDVAWSANSAKYLALLSELSAMSRNIAAIPGPGLRYQSKLAGLLPENTVIFAAIPNLANTLAEANGMFEARVAESPVLKEWWNQQETQQVRAIVDQVRTFGEYLGDEVVLAIPSVNGQIQSPMVIAEARKAGLSDFLDRQFATLKGAGAPIPVAMVHGNVVVLGGQPAQVARISSLVDSAGRSGFTATSFGQRISESYQSGAGWIFAADMEQITQAHVPTTVHVSDASKTAGFDNVRYLVIERKENLGRTENSAALSFSGSRHGIMSWLAAPGPMGTLDFVSPEASFAASFVIRNPGEVLQEVIGITGAQTGPAAVINAVQQQTGINLMNDIAANLGGEMTIAFDGPLLPTPAWKIAIEVDNPARLEWAFEQAVQTAQRDDPASAVTLTTSTANGLTYHTLKTTSLPIEIDYVFSDGYLVLGSSQGVLQNAVESRASGLTLSRSSAFRAQMPQGGHANFSALLYYNMGSTVGPIVDQLKKGGLMTPDQQGALGSLISNREPGLIYAFGEPDRIVVASRSGFFGLDLSTLVGLNAKGMAALPQLLPLGFTSKK